LFAKAKSAAAKADQLRLTGADDSAGKHIDIDLGYTKTGAYGTVAIDGPKVTLLTRDGATWFKAGEDFWRKNGGFRAGAIIKLINGRWIKVDPTDRTLESVTGVTNRSEQLDKLMSGVSVQKGDRTTVDGVDCIGLKNWRGDVLNVAVSDMRPVEIRQANGGHLAFRYNGVTIPPAPAASDVVDSRDLSAKPSS
jgi:hypothetical protein